MLRNLVISVGAGFAANGAWYFSDYATWSAWGWIVVAMMALILMAVLDND